MLNSFSERLRICRAISNHSIKEVVDFVNQSGLSFSSKQYSRWETSKIDTPRILKNDVLRSIVDLFNQSGLDELSADWLLSGKGLPPFLVDMSNTLDEEKAFYIARAMGDEYTLSTVASNYAEPYAGPGDQIITRISIPEKLENRIGFIKTKQHTLHLGIIKNREEKINVFNSDLMQTIKKADIIYCGKLCWIN